MKFGLLRQYPMTIRITAERQKLADLDAHVEGQKVGQQSVFGDLVSRILVARPVPWNRPKISVAALVLGWNPNHFWNAPRLSSAL